MIEVPAAAPNLEDEHYVILNTEDVNSDDFYNTTGNS